MGNITWDMWANVHDNPDQKKRIESATKAACTPILLDQTTCTGKFKGSSGNHTTALNKCSCVDFNRRKLPCKHMYRLAMELHLLDVPFQTDPSQIVEPHSSSRIPLEESIRVIEQLTIPQQKLLCDILRQVNSTNPTCCVRTTYDLQILLDSGILLPDSDISIALKKYKKAELVELVNSFGIDFPDYVQRKNEMIDFLLENAKDFLCTVPLSFTTVRYNPSTKYGKIHMYLHRKFDHECFFDPEIAEMLDIPVIETDLPHDDVTDLLIKNGYYSEI